MNLVFYSGAFRLNTSEVTILSSSPLVLESNNNITLIKYVDKLRKLYL